MKTSLGVAVNEAGSARRKNKPGTSAAPPSGAPIETKFNAAANSALIAILMED